MNGIEKIIERIEQDVQQEIDKITADARAEADQITARHTQRAEAEGENLKRRALEAAEARYRSQVSVSELDARKLVLGAKQEMLDKAFAAAEDDLCALPEDQYISLLVSLAADASRSGKEAVLLSQKDRTQIGKQVVTGANAKLGGSAALTLSEQSAPIKGGVILKEGDVEINCAVETLVRMIRSEIATEVAQSLFSD